MNNRRGTAADILLSGRRNFSSRLGHASPQSISMVLPAIVRDVGPNGIMASICYFLVLCLLHCSPARIRLGESIGTLFSATLNRSVEQRDQPSAAYRGCGEHDAVVYFIGTAQNFPLDSHLYRTAGSMMLGGSHVGSNIGNPCRHRQSLGRRGRTIRWMPITRPVPR